MHHCAFIGIDIGTQGVRAAALLDNGELCSSASQPFHAEDLPRMRQEQDPEAWWQAVLICLRKIVSDVKHRDASIRIHAVTVSSTSGTVLPLGADYRPLHPAIMYSDQRSGEVAKACTEAANRAGIAGYSNFTSSSGLSKIVWFHRTLPKAAERIALWAHAADYIVGRLSGVWGVTDSTNSLKTGFDLENNAWPDYIHSRLGISSERLPKVVPTGATIGNVARGVAEATGLPESAQVTVGVTDSCASQIASGAFRPGDWNTTIGTTMVIKGVTEKPVQDRHGRIYNHKHPEGYWMPGGASNTGADWVTLMFPNADLDRFNRQASALTPSPWIAYPLMQQGERFPFASPQARGFVPPGLKPEEAYTAMMEGTAYLERLAYALLRQLSGERIGQVFTAGGASNSATWLQIRSDVLQVPIVKMKHTTGAAGAAVLSASRTFYASLSEAGAALLRPETVVEPGSAALRERYERSYETFLGELQRRGYLI